MDDFNTSSEDFSDQSDDVPHIEHIGEETELPFLETPLGHDAAKSSGMDTPGFSKNAKAVSKNMIPLETCEEVNMLDEYVHEKIAAKKAKELSQSESKTLDSRSKQKISAAKAKVNKN